MYRMLILNDKRRKSHGASLNEGSNCASNSCEACVIHICIYVYY